MGSDQVQLFGEFRIWCNSSDETPSLLSAQKLVGLLCQRPDYRWPRTEVGRTFWPESDDESNRNRIRTALVQARSAFQNSEVIQGDKYTVALNGELLSCDLWRARALVRRAQGSTDETEEELALVQLLEIIRLPYLSVFSDDWVLSERRRWRDRSFDIQIRLGLLAETREDWTTALDYYESILLSSPYDERVWAAILRAYSRNGRHIEIYERFSATKSRLRKELGGRFSPSLVSLAESLSNGRQYAPQILASQGDMASRTFGRMMSNHPADALRFLSSEAFRVEIFHAPQLAVNLLERTIAATNEESEERFQCIAYAIIAHSLLNHQLDIPRLAPIILNHDRNLVRQRGAASAIAFANFQTRDWNGAFHYGKLTLEIAGKIGNQIGIQLAIAQLASFDMHVGKLEEALEAYKKCLSQLSRHKEQSALAGRCVISVNIGIIYAVSGNFEMAKTWLSKGVGLSNIADNPTILVLALPALGSVNIVLGEKEKGMEILAKGIGQAFRHKDERSLEIGFDFVALALAYLGHFGQSLAVVEHVRRYRIETQHARSVAEEMLVDQINHLCKSYEINQEWLALPSRRHLVAAILDLIS